MSVGYPVISHGKIEIGDFVVPIDLTFIEPGVRKYIPDIDNLNSIIGQRLQSSKELQNSYILVSFNKNYLYPKLSESFQGLKV